jgi:hypothetical protein
MSRYSLRSQGPVEVAAPAEADDSISSASSATPEHEEIEDVSSSSSASTSGSDTQEATPEEDREAISRYERAVEEEAHMTLAGSGLRETCTYFVQSGARLYRVRQRYIEGNDEHSLFEWDCECEDFFRRGQPRHISCKHIFWVQRTQCGARGYSVPQNQLWMQMREEQGKRPPAHIRQDLLRGRLLRQARRSKQY